MQTALTDAIKQTAAGAEADAILRACVHCGFCTATCPTYQLEGDELDGPRGRIYLIKQVLEGGEVTAKTQYHLDRCLNCRSCETTCPSGVRYGRLLDIGRESVDQQVTRPLVDRWQRLVLRMILPRPRLMQPLVAVGALLWPLLPATVQRKLPVVKPAGPWPGAAHARRMLVLDGCVQSVMSPGTNAAAAKLLDRLGVTLVRAAKAGCCGAINYHLGASDDGLNDARRNIDAWWPWVESGVDAIVVSASGCGTMVKEYGELLKRDKVYAQKAHRVSELAKDLSEVVAAEDLTSLGIDGAGCKVAVQTPCSLQHGQQLNGVVENILTGLGFELTLVADGYLCCGSGGTYSLLQKKLSQQLLKNKVEALQRGGPELIATANIGCQLHLMSQAEVPVKHWIELIADRINPTVA